MNILHINGTNDLDNVRGKHSLCLTVRLRLKSGWITFEKGFGGPGVEIKGQ